MEGKERARILCVDDEPNILEGLRLHLRRGYQVVTAGSGKEGLSQLQQQGPFAIVVSDMRMPEMNGAAFLAQVRQQAPDSVRMLLTGQAEIEAAIAAINEGQIFRFLTKPCQPQVLLAACEAAAEQHRLITAERVLLQQTLHGCIRALSEVLAQANPMAFGRATRIKQYVARMAVQLSLKDTWEIEVAAVLSQVGYAILPPQVVEKMTHGQALSSTEQAMVEKLPQMAEQLIGHIPRLEGVREIVVRQNQRFDATQNAESIPLGSRLLKIAQDYDVLEAQDVPQQTTFQIMRGRTGLYDPQLLATFAAMMTSAGQAEEIREVRLRELQPGMTLVDHVRTTTGTLLIARGYEITPGLMERMRNFPPGLVREPLRVVVRRSAGEAPVQPPLG